MVKIAVSGSEGKMGSRIVDLSKEDPELSIAGTYDAGGDAEAAVAACDCLIDFTSPEGTMANLELALKHKKALVIGTTGLSEGQKEKVAAAAGSIPVVFSPNMSIGVNVLFKIVREAARVLGSEYDVSILEAHHVHKKDAPSGTAKELSHIVKEAGHAKHVPIESVREDEIVGEHTITFESPVDVLELTHSAKTRDIFVKGSLAAAKFAVTKQSGLFTMKDVLGL